MIFFIYLREDAVRMDSGRTCPRARAGVEKRSIFATRGPLPTTQLPPRPPWKKVALQFTENDWKKKGSELSVFNPVLRTGERIRARGRRRGAEGDWTPWNKRVKKWTRNWKKKTKWKKKEKTGNKVGRKKKRWPFFFVEGFATSIFEMALICRRERRMERERKREMEKGRERRKEKGKRWEKARQGGGNGKAFRGLQAGAVGGGFPSVGVSQPLTSYFVAGIQCC